MNFKRTGQAAPKPPPDFRKKGANWREKWRNYMFPGGHRKQTREGEIKYPLNIELVENMHTLCEKILNGEISPSKKKYWTCSITCFTEPCRVGVIEQLYFFLSFAGYACGSA
jgi:hypothetical protein